MTFVDFYPIVFGIDENEPKGKHPFPRFSLQFSFQNGEFINIHVHDDFRVASGLNMYLIKSTNV